MPDPNQAYYDWKEGKLKYAPIEFEDKSFSHFTPEKRAQLWDSGLRPARQGWAKAFPDEKDMRVQFVDKGELSYRNDQGLAKPEDQWTKQNHRDELRAYQFKIRGEDKAPLPHTDKTLKPADRYVKTIQWFRDNPEATNRFDPATVAYGAAKRLPLTFGILDWIEMGHDKAAMDRMYEGKATDDDYYKLAKSVVASEQEEEDPFAMQALRQLSYLPGFAADIAATGGVSAIGKAAGSKAAGKLAKHFGAKKFKEFMQKSAVKKVAGAGLEAGVFAGVIRGGTTMGEAIPTRDLKFDDATKTGFAKTEKESWFNTLPKSIANQVIEYSVERFTGKAVGKLAGKVRTHLRPASKIDPNVVPDDLVNLLKKRAVTAWKIQNPGRASLAGKIGYNGMITEMGEEQLTEALQGVSEAFFSTMPGYARDAGPQIDAKFGLTGDIAQELGYQTGLTDETEAQAVDRRDQMAKQFATQALGVGAMGGAMRAIGGRPSDDPVLGLKDPVLALAARNIEPERQKIVDQYKQDVGDLIKTQKSSRSAFESVRLPDAVMNEDGTVVQEATTLYDHYKNSEQREGFLNEANQMNQAISRQDHEEEILERAERTRAEQQEQQEQRDALQATSQLAQDAWEQEQRERQQAQPEAAVEPPVAVEAQQEAPEEFTVTNEAGGQHDITLLEGESHDGNDSLHVEGRRPQLKRDDDGNAVETTREDNSWSVIVNWEPDPKTERTDDVVFDNEADARAAAAAVQGLPRSEQGEKLRAIKAGDISIPVQQAAAVEAPPVIEQPPPVPNLEQKAGALDTIDYGVEQLQELDDAGDDRELPAVNDIEQDNKNVETVSQIGITDVRKLVPGRKVNETDYGFDVFFEGGRVPVYMSQDMDLTKEEIETVYNQYANSKSKKFTHWKVDKKSGKVKSFTDVFPTVESYSEYLDARGGIAGTTTASKGGQQGELGWDILATVRINDTDWSRANRKQMDVLRHELVHVAHLSGMWNKAELAALMKEYKIDPTSSAVVQSEGLASNMEVWNKPGMLERFTDWINRLMNKIMPGKFELKPSAVKNLLQQEKFWGRQTQEFSEFVASQDQGKQQRRGQELLNKVQTLGMVDRPKLADSDWADRVVYSALGKEGVAPASMSNAIHRFYEASVQRAEEAAKAERKAKGLAAKRAAGPYHEMTREEFEATGEDLYHGTSRNFDVFDWEKAKTRTGGSQKELSDFKARQQGTTGNLSRFYFTDNKSVAETFAEETGGMVQVNLHQVVMHETDKWGYSEWDPDEGHYESDAELLTEYKSRLRKTIERHGMDLWYRDWWSPDIGHHGEMVQADDPDNIPDEMWRADDVEILVYPGGEKPRVIKARVYGRTLDLRKDAKRPEGFPEEFERFLGQLQYQHEYAPVLIKWARDNGYGKIRVEDHGTSGGESVIGLQEFIGYGTDPHKEMLQRAFDAGQNVPSDALGDYDVIEGDDGSFTLGMAEPDLDIHGREPGQANQSPVNPGISPEARDAYDVADAAREKTVITRETVKLVVDRRRSGTAQERAAADEAALEKWRNNPNDFDVFEHEHMIRWAEELSFSKKPGDYDKAIEIILLKREAVAMQARSVAYGKDPYRNNPILKRYSSLQDAIFKTSREELARFAQRKSKDPRKAKAGQRAYNKEEKRIAKVRKYIEKLGYAFTKEGLRRLARNRKDAYKVAQVAVRSKWSYGTWANNLFSEYTYGSMLSGLNTQVVNLLSNTTWGFAMELEQFGAATMNSVFNNSQNITLQDYKSAWNRGEVKYKPEEMGVILKTAFKNGWARWKTEQAVLEEQIGVEEKVKMERNVPAIPGAIGKGFRFIHGFGPMAAVDQFYKTLFTHMDVGVHAFSLARQQVERFNRNNPKRKQMTQEDINRIAEEMINDKQSQAWFDSLQEAEQKMFQDEGGYISKKVLGAAKTLRNLPFGLGAGFQHLVAPFVKTPVRLMGNAVIRLPGFGTVVTSGKMISNYKDGKHVLDGVSRELVGQLAVGLLGTAIAMGVSEDEEETMFTGAKGSLGKESRSFRYHEGVAPSQGVKLFGQWVQYDRFDPFAVQIAAIVDGVHALKSGKGAGVALLDVALSTAASIQEKSFTRSLGDLMKAVEDDGVSGQRWIASALTRLYPNLYQQISRANRPTIGEKRGDTVFEEFTKRAELAPSEDIHDPWGRKAESAGWSPIKHKGADTFVGDRVFLNWNRLNPDVTRPKYPTRPSRDYRREGVDRRMDDKTYAEYARLAGTLSRNVIEKMVSPEMGRNPSDRIMAMVESSLSRGRVRVKDHLHKTGKLEGFDMQREERMLQSALYSSMLGAMKKKRPIQYGQPAEEYQEELDKWQRDRDAAMDYAKWYRQSSNTRIRQ